MNYTPLIDQQLGSLLKFFFGKKVSDVQECLREDNYSRRGWGFNCDPPSAPEAQFDPEIRQCYLTFEMFLKDCSLDPDKIEDFRRDLQSHFAYGRDRSTIPREQWEDYILKFPGTLEQQISILDTFIRQIHYVPWTEFVKSLEAVCDGLKNYLTGAPRGSTVIFFSREDDEDDFGDRPKSNDYILAVAWWKCGLRKIIHDLCSSGHINVHNALVASDRDVPAQIGTSTIFVVFDDALYSGKQMDIYVFGAMEKILEDVTLLAVVPYVTEFALERLRHNEKQRVIYHEKMPGISEIKKLIYDIHMDKMDPETLHEIIDRLSNYICESSAEYNVLTYFQHKLPDDVSACSKRFIEQLVKETPIPWYKCECLGQRMRQNNLVSVHLPFDDGIRRGELPQSELMEIIDDTTNQTFFNNRQQEESRTPIVESVLPNKKRTSRGRNNRCKKRTRTTKSSQILARASTSKEKDCYGWWTKSCEEMSKKLWCPTVTACADLPTSSSNTYATSTVRNSWSKIKKYVPLNKSSQKTLWQSFTSSRVATTECEDTSNVIKCQKIRLRPTPVQARILRQWMKSARMTYNLALRLVKDKKAKMSLDLKKDVVTRRKEDNDKTRLMKETPAKIRQQAIRDLLFANKTSWAGFRARVQREKMQKKRWKKKRKKKTNKKLHRRRWKKRPPFDLKYKSKRCMSDSFGMEGCSIRVEDHHLFLFSTDSKFNMQDGIKMSEQAEHPTNVCCRIQFVYGRWYFLLPYQDTKDDEEPTRRFVALDPGVRTFQTYYTDDEAGEIGYDTNKKIDYINKKIASIRRRISDLQRLGGNRKKVNRLKRAWYRSNARSSNLVTDFHWHTIKFLLDNFDVIVAPQLGVHGIISRGNQLPEVVRDRLLTLRHGQFRQRLCMKASLRGKTILNLEEHGTSVTCSRCGHINKHLGSSKTFECSVCNLVMDRDINSSRNHAIKALVGKTNY